MNRRHLRTSRLALAAAGISTAATGCGGEGPNQSTADSAGVSVSAAPVTPAAPEPTPAPAAPGAKADQRPEIDPKNVAASIKYDAATKTATIPMISGLTTNAGGWNFNGYARGEMTIVVPVGTIVVMPYYNDDIVPHSAVAVSGSAKSIPSAPGDPVFRGAETRSADNGLMTGQHDDMRFTADKPGKYLLVCGVPGHAQSGMWVYLQVSPSAKAPTVVLG